MLNGGEQYFKRNEEYSIYDWNGHALAQKNPAPAVMKYTYLVYPPKLIITTSWFPAQARPKTEYFNWIMISMMR